MSVCEGRPDRDYLQDVTTLWPHRPLGPTRLTCRTASSPNGQSHSCAEPFAVVPWGHPGTSGSHSVPCPSSFSTQQLLRDLVKTVLVASGVPNPTWLSASWLNGLDENLPEAQREGVDVSRVGSVVWCYHKTSGWPRTRPTLSHSLVEPGTTDLSGWSRTSSLRAVIFIDCNNFSYSPRLGSSPIPTTMMQSAYHTYHISPGTGKSPPD